MILVTLGTQDKGFSRLLDAVLKEIENGTITEEVIVQTGHTKYESDKMKIFDFVSIEEMNNLIEKSRIVISHGGVGTIINALKHNKKVIVAPRLKQYGEHTNDHQLQIINNFSKKGFIIPLHDFNELGDHIKNIDNFTPNKYESNQENFIKNIENSIKAF